MKPGDTVMWSNPHNYRGRIGPMKVAFVTYIPPVVPQMYGTMECVVFVPAANRAVVVSQHRLTEIPVRCEATCTPAGGVWVIQCERGVENPHSTHWAHMDNTTGLHKIKVMWH